MSDEDYDEFDPDNYWQYYDLFGSDFDASIHVREPVFTGLFDSKGNYIIRCPVKTPQMGFLSKDSFEHDPEEEYYYRKEAPQKG